MRCDEFDERVHGLLDERIPLQTDQRLLQHAEDCARCQGQLVAYEDMFNGLDFFEPPQLAEDFAARVVEQVQPVHPATEFARRWLTFAALAIAASLLIALIPALTGRPWGTEPESTRLVQEDTLNHSHESPGESSAGEWPGHQIAQLPHGSIDIPEGMDAEQIRLMWNQLAPDLPYERIVPVDQIRGGLRPITNSLAVAIDMLRSTIPLRKQGQSTESPTDSTRTRPITPGCISV
jgi:hypothetical protein